ncbi:AAA family ATPase [Paractinoplanes atraurantiacus]|uniref:AAA domain-containing protein n=1 Tax=Paractinoplanes atraurantiacus TaxID=1036182 RepID=A0A285F1C3_9ACTN|nr:AAA family ATPase [Actinoplanes atraurantiacus]SNY04186.1 AAA domain-containing protein [Actinoplanes atraurantiacus]
MPRVLVTGMSGTGKSTALTLLAARGHHTVDTDTDEWSEWSGDDWIWRSGRITELLTTTPDVFVAGCKSNQGRFYPLFDHIVLLSAPAAVLLARVETRTTNPYGKTPADRAEILTNLATVEPLLRATATAEIDATQPAAEVARRLEALTTMR